MAPPASSGPNRRTALHGAVAGVAAFVVGYVLTYAWRAQAIEESFGGINFLAELFGGRALPTWKAVGWLYLNAHAVAVRVDGLAGGQVVNLIQESDDGSLLLLYALVALVLLLGGAAVARYERHARLTEAAAAGAAVVIGYLPLAVVLGFASAHTFGGDVRVAPDLLTAVLLAGVVLPAFFGAVGGALADWVGSRLGS